MKASIRVAAENRDALARVAETELGRASWDEALRIVLFEHQTRAALARLAADPDERDAYVSEAGDLADVDASVVE